MIQPTKLGWMAGVIDLKGRVTEKENKLRKSSKQITMMIETREIHIIRELCSLTGTNPEIRKRQPLKEWMRRGCTEHCPDQHIHVEDTRTMPEVGRWTISGAALAVVLFNLMPFLITQGQYKELYEKILKEAPLAGRGAAAVILSIRRLALLGWDLPEEFEGIEL
jgi:hypothetical protein